jgi:hypothetical protein
VLGDFQAVLAVYTSETILARFEESKDFYFAILKPAAEILAVFDVYSEILDVKLVKKSLKRCV